MHPINHVGSEIGLDSSFEPYLSLDLVNGKEIPVLRDSDLKLDVISRKLITSDQLNREFTWVKQPLENEVRCSPLANNSLNTGNRVSEFQGGCCRPYSEIKIL